MPPPARGLQQQQPATLAQKAQKWFNTFKDWTWQANKLSPQTGRMYPSTGKFHNGQTSVKLSDMFAGLKVKSEWADDFKNTVMAWCNDLVEKLHPNLNRMKDLAGIKDDINASNKEAYRAALASINAQFLSAQPATIAATNQTPTYAQFVANQQPAVSLKT